MFAAVWIGLIVGSFAGWRRVRGLTNTVQKSHNQNRRGHPRLCVFFLLLELTKVYATGLTEEDMNKAQVGISRYVLLEVANCSV
jgi:hypothetical protein